MLRALAAIAVLVCTPVVGRTVSTITTTGWANATTLPFQRHITRVGPPTVGAGFLYVAVNRQGQGAGGLMLYLSKDGGKTWTEIAGIQPNRNPRDMADMIADPNGAMGFSLLYSVEPESSSFGPDTATDVVFLHYSVGSSGSVSIDRGPMTLFHPGSNQGYYRAALTRDSAGTLHATASLVNGTSYSWLERMSIDDGQEWTTATTLASFGGSFGGGRIVAYGANVMAIYDAYTTSQQGRYRTKAAGACSDWSSERNFVPEGLYHAGAFGVTTTPDGHVHLGYSDKPNEQLWYREFDGTSWSSATRIESVGVWSNQPGLSHQGNTVFFSWNHYISDNDNRMFAKTKPAGGSFGSTITLDNSTLFKGYTNAIDEVLPGEQVQVLYCQMDINGGIATVKVAQFTP